jgi:hypothetical protein
MTTDPTSAIDTGSPALAMLLLSLGGAIAGRAFVGRALLTRALRQPSA